jgi:hypothetical protein
MAIDPYSGNFDLMTTIQQFAPLAMAYMMMQQMNADPKADMAGARAQGMASMMPDRQMGQAQPMGGPPPPMGPQPPMGGPVPGQPVSPYSGPGGMNPQGMSAVNQLMQQGQQPAQVAPMPQEGGNALMQLLPIIAGLILGGPTGGAAGAGIGRAIGG